MRKRNQSSVNHVEKEEDLERSETKTKIIKVESQSLPKQNHPRNQNQKPKIILIMTLLNILKRKSHHLHLKREDERK